MVPVVGLGLIAAGLLILMASLRPGQRLGLDTFGAKVGLWAIAIGILTYLVGSK